jgi:hypothetical protein
MGQHGRELREWVIDDRVEPTKILRGRVRGQREGERAYQMLVREKTEDVRGSGEIVGEGER